MTHRGGVDQLIGCRIIGTRAARVAPHLVAGKRVVVTGELRLPIGNRATLLLVDICELAGGPRTSREAEPQGEDATAQRD